MEVHDRLRDRRAATYVSETSRQELRGGLENGQCNPIQSEISFDVTHGGDVVGFKALTNDDGAAAPFNAELTFEDDTGTEIGAQRVDQGVMLEWRLTFTAQTATESLVYAGKKGRVDAGGNPVTFDLR